MGRFDSFLNPEEIAIIKSEEEILRTVLAGIADSRRRLSFDRHKIGEGWKQLRDEASKAKDSDLPAIFDQMNTQRALIELPEAQALPDSRSPYFARMQLLEKGKKKNVLIGFSTYLDISGTPLIDWRHAPVSRIFFNYRVGDYYEEELPSRLAEGEMTLRHVLTIQNGQLVQIITPEGSFRLEKAGTWHKENSNSLPTLTGGAGTANRQMTLGSGRGGLAGPEVSALLDREQFEILNDDPNEPLLILGSAGCGKTTVALHRMALLNYRYPQNFKESDMILVVPDEGLVRLSNKLLRSLGLFKVQVTTFDKWVETQARLVIKGLPKKVYPHTPGNVVRFKRHSRIRDLFPLLVEQNIASIQREFKSKFYSEEIDSYLKDEQIPIAQRYDLAESALSNLWKKNPLKAKKIAPLHSFFREQRRKLLDLNKDRFDLFATDRFLKNVVQASNGELSENFIKDVKRHCLDQFADNHQDGYDSYDDDKLRTIDGKSLAHEKNEEIIDSIDPEDFAILLELFDFKTQAQHSPHGKLHQYSHLVLDEAQELAPLELNCLGRALAPKGAVTIAGDAAQQTDPSTVFDSWNQIVSRLLYPRGSHDQPKINIRPNELTTNYRSTKDIAEFSHRILGSSAPAKMPSATKPGLPVSRSLFANEGHMTVFLCEILTDLMSKEPNCSAAIIAKTGTTASRIYNAISHVSKTRLVTNGEFDFKPGIDVTEVSQVKGLEFDYVIIPDASLGIYKDLPEHRRILHVATTRAIHQLWVISVGKETPIFNNPN